MTNSHSKQQDYPFLAPCKTLTFGAPWRWLIAGIYDVRKAPIASLSYGLVMTFMAVSIAILAVGYGNAWAILSLLCIFVFAAPLACVGTYAISAQLERGQKVSIRRSLRACFQRYIGSELVFVLVLLVIMLIWGRASSMVSIFLPVNPDSNVQQLVFYSVAIASVSGFFLSLIFTASVFSLPMIMHRDVDTVTAIISSINAVLRNKLVMVSWAILICLSLIVGFLTLGLGLIILLPAVGHAVWHGYIDTIDASEFPRHKRGITSTSRSHR